MVFFQSLSFLLQTTNSEQWPHDDADDDDDDDVNDDDDDDNDDCGVDDDAAFIPVSAENIKDIKNRF